MKVATLVMHTDPMEQLHLLAHHCATDTASNIIGIHMYSFGGFPGSAQCGCTMLLPLRQPLWALCTPRRLGKAGGVVASGATSKTS